MMRRVLLLAGIATAGAVLAAATGTPSNAAPSGNVRYQLGLLVRGPTWTPARTPRTDSIQAGHMANIGRMWEHGALVAAGPFENGGQLRGVFVFRPGRDPLDSLMAPDPAIASGRLECRLHAWEAPAGIGEDYRRHAETVARTGTGKRDSMVTFGWVMLERGPRFDSTASAASRRLMTEHEAYTGKLRAGGQLVFSGRVEGAGDLQRVLVMSSDSSSAARAMAEDPAVRAGHFSPRVLKWWTAWGSIPGH